MNLIPGDIGRPEVLKGFHLQEARACVVTLSDMSATNKAVVQLRKLYPVVPIVARAKNREHQQRLENMFGESAFLFICSVIFACIY